MEKGQELLPELRRITKLVALIATKDQNQTERIQILSSAGFPPADIADIVGTTPNTVNVTLARLRKRGTSRSKPGAGKVND